MPCFSIVFQLYSKKQARFSHPGQFKFSKMLDSSMWQGDRN